MFGASRGTGDQPLQPALFSRNGQHRPVLRINMQRPTNAHAARLINSQWHKGVLSANWNNKMLMQNEPNSDYINDDNS